MLADYIDGENMFGRQEPNLCFGKLGRSRERIENLNIILLFHQFKPLIIIIINNTIDNTTILTIILDDDIHFY